MTPTSRKTRTLSKARRAAAAESCLARIMDGWIPAWVQNEWVREAPNAKAMKWKTEPMSPDESQLLGEYR